VASRFNGFTRGILLLGVFVFMRDSFSLTRNQGLCFCKRKVSK
jgi:hypothetical protein